MQSSYALVLQELAHYIQISQMKISVSLLLLVMIVSCKKGIDPVVVSPRDTTVITTPVIPVDPETAASIGFFMNDWLPRTFVTPPYTDVPMPSFSGVVIEVDPSSIITKIPPSIFGNNANPFMTQMVTQPSLINHIKNLNPHIIRFPGGNLSSVFFWNAENNAKPADAPDTLVDADGKQFKSNYWYGKNTDSWTLSLDNYYAMLQQTNSQGIITVNYGYARYGTSANPVASAAHLAADWVRYDNGRTKYWEIGNESNGTWQDGYRIILSKNKDGQPEKVTGDLYGQHYKVFKDSMMKAAQQIGKTIYVGAQLLELEPASWATPTDKSWNSGVLSKAGSVADYFIIHSYYTNYAENSQPTVVLNSAIDRTKAMMDYMKLTTGSNAVSMKPIALTEWNIFSEGSMQQVSNINGMHASLVLGELLKNKYGMASRWDLANGWSNGNDHGMFSNGDEPGIAKWTPRPVFYHMYYFQKMMGDRLISTTLTGSSDLSVYASSFSSGQVGLVIVNRSTSSLDPTISFKNFTPGNRAYWYTLTGGADNGEFSRKVIVNGSGPTQAAGGPENYFDIKTYSSTLSSNMRVTVPGRGVIYMVVEKK